MIGRPIAIRYFLARKITAECAEVRRAVSRLFPLRVPLRTPRLNSLFGCSMLHVPDSSCIVKFSDSGFGYLSGYNYSNYSGMLIGRPIAILYFPARKITAECAEERRVVNRLFPLRASLRTLRLNSLFGSGCVPGQAMPI